MSTDKPTPQTDAKSSTREIRNLNAFWTVEEVPANFARTLERQRDEYSRQLAEVTRERDEALRGISDQFLGVITKRDEVISENAQLRAELAALREEAEKWKRVCRSYDDSPSRKFREEFKQLQSNHSQLRQDACKILRELIQSQLHFDYCRAMYQEGGDNESQLAQEVSEASCRRSDSVEVGEEFLRLNAPKPLTAEHTPAEETKSSAPSGMLEAVRKAFAALEAGHYSEARRLLVAYCPPEGKA